ncbi:hypothetical protein GFY24_14515 [Nocardia sp. SYP-A9097]|uniref:hypothetical protein n=1 Tax=Nocardia sp. SYP-A9097 TaxID=2663237 RepID=UPI00129B1CDA|nr:hypothetical protein [Nocardia sp. SYP-A9097]MRH88642.1 hypothetical protein [Nocardia sp. SYP-A9097]
MTDAGAVGSDAAGQDWASVTAASPSGAIRMKVTEQGLPLAVKVDAAELHRDPSQLAAEMLRLCQRAAARAGLAKRKQLQEAGMSAAALARTGLPTEADVARQEIVEEQDYDTEPQSWLRTV